MPGGAVFREQNIILSPFEDDGINRYHATKLFMGAAAIGPRGLMQADVVWNFARFGAAVNGPMMQVNLLASAPRLEVPLLLIQGDQDDVTPPAEVLADALAPADDPEPAGFVQRQAGGVLGEDAGLDRPDPGGLG